MSEFQTRMNCRHNSYTTTSSYIGKPFKDIECQVCSTSGRIYDDGRIEWRDKIHKSQSPINKNFVGKSFQRTGIRR